jgi:predicted transcriptional regulator of viral defense system
MTAKQTLWDVAMDQDGFVTSADVRGLGLPVNELAQLAYRGKLVRAATGVYRFDEFPAGRAAQYRLAVLWTGRTDAVLSHETALDLLDLCDINPDRIHVTVPKGTRIRRSGGDGIALHHEDLTARDLSWWEGIRCVTANAAIRQGIDAGVPVHLLKQAMETARSRGSITPAELRALTQHQEDRFVRSIR